MPSEQATADRANENSKPNCSFCGKQPKGTTIIRSMHQSKVAICAPCIGNCVLSLASNVADLSEKIVKLKRGERDLELDADVSEGGIHA